MSKRKPWEEQETESDSQEESVVSDMKEKARLLNMEADKSQTAADMIEAHGADPDLVDQFKETVPGKKATANELEFVAKILERTRKV